MEAATARVATEAKRVVEASSISSTHIGGGVSAGASAGGSIKRQPRESSLVMVQHSSAVQSAEVVQAIGGSPIPSAGWAATMAMMAVRAKDFIC